MAVSDDEQRFIDRHRIGVGNIVQQGDRLPVRGCDRLGKARVQRAAELRKRSDHGVGRGGNGHGAFALAGRHVAVDRLNEIVPGRRIDRQCVAVSDDEQRFIDRHRIGVGNIVQQGDRLPVRGCDRRGKAEIARLTDRRDVVRNDLIITGPVAFRRKQQCITLCKVGGGRRCRVVAASELIGGVDGRAQAALDHGAAGDRQRQRTVVIDVPVQNRVAADRQGRAVALRAEGAQHDGLRRIRRPEAASQRGEARSCSDPELVAFHRARGGIAAVNDGQIAIVQVFVNALCSDPKVPDVAKHVSVQIECQRLSGKFQIVTRVIHVCEQHDDVVVLRRLQRGFKAGVHGVANAHCNQADPAVALRIIGLRRKNGVSRRDRSRRVKAARKGERRRAAAAARANGLCAAAADRVDQTPADRNRAAAAAAAADTCCVPAADGVDRTAGDRDAAAAGPPVFQTAAADARAVFTAEGIDGTSRDRDVALAAQTAADAGCAVARAGRDRAAVDRHAADHIGGVAVADAGARDAAFAWSAGGCDRAAVDPDGTAAP